MAEGEKDGKFQKIAHSLNPKEQRNAVNFSKPLLLLLLLLLSSVHVLCSPDESSETTLDAMIMDG